MPKVMCFEFPTWWWAIACRQDDDDNPQEQGPKEFCLNLVDSLVSLAGKALAHVHSCCAISYARWMGHEQKDRKNSELYYRSL